MTDFSSLPEVIWVRIMQKLSFPDRLNVACCCKLLKDTFAHPSIWDSIEISLVNREDDDLHWDFVPVSTNRYVAMLNSFGKYVKHLTLVYIGGGFRVSNDAIAVLRTLGRCSKLESLVVDVDTRLSDSEMLGLGSRYINLVPIVDFISGCTTLHKLGLRSWPSYPGVQSVDLLGALMSYPTIRAVDNLCLFWESAEDATWVSLNVIIPGPEQMLHLTQYFGNLQELCLRSSMLTDDVINELARLSRRPLLKLGVLLTYSYSTNLKVKHMHEISSSSWLKLVERSPDLKVFITLMTRTPYEEIMSYLKPEVPVYSIGFMRYANLTEDIVLAITERYSTTLRQFICQNDPPGLDKVLLKLVKDCGNLTYLAFNGDISHEAVLRLAEMRNTRWSKFQFVEENIKTDSPPIRDIDENTIIDRRESGELYVVQHELLREGQQDENERIRILDELNQQVSASVGYTWRPRSARSFERNIKVRSMAPTEGTLSDSQTTCIPTKYPLAHGWQWKQC